MKKFKRIALFLLSALIFASSFAFGAFAASKQEIIDAARSKIPAGSEFIYMIQLENILMQVELTPEQGDRVIEIIGEMDKIVRENGQQLRLYSKDLLEITTGYVYEICEMANLTYEYKVASPASYAGDVVIVIRDAGGNYLGEFDGSKELPLVKKTNAAVLPDTSVLLPAASAVILAAGIFLIIRNKKVLA